LSWGVEERLLRFYCLAETRRKAEPGIAKREKTNLDWGLFLEKARANGIGAIVYLKLKDGQYPFLEIPGDIIEELKRDYYLNAAKNALIFKELNSVLKAFRESGPPVMVLKGAALASSVYINPALRPMTDVDLLVKRKDFKIADGTMEALGYRSSDRPAGGINSFSSYLTTLDYHHSFTNSPSFHLHWHFVNSTVPNESYINDVKMEHIWRDAEKTEIAGVETLVMAPHHLIIHLSEHGLRVTHSLSKLIFFCDIDKAVNFFRTRLDWNKLAKESIDFRLERMVYIGLHFTSLFMDTEIPGEVLSDLEPKRWSLGEKVFMNAVLNNRRRAGLSYFVHLAMNRGFTKKMEFVWRTFFPPRRILAQRSYSRSGKIHPFHYFLRIHEVFLSFLRVLRSWTQ